MSLQHDLGALEGVVRAELDSKFAAREMALTGCRQIIRSSANAIRALHRGEDKRARELMDQARALIATIREPLMEHRDILYAGFFYDAAKEYAEAELTAALFSGAQLPLPAELDLGSVAYLKGLGETVGEMRRRLLDQLRAGQLGSAEMTFRSMEIVQDLLQSLDYPDGMTAGLRRTTDIGRALIERSHADLTTAVVQERLRDRLEQLGS